MAREVSLINLPWIWKKQVFNWLIDSMNLLEEIYLWFHCLEQQSQWDNGSSCHKLRNHVFHLCENETHKDEFCCKLFGTWILYIRDWYLGRTWLALFWTKDKCMNECYHLYRLSKNQVTLAGFRSIVSFGQ